MHGGSYFVCPTVVDNTVLGAIRKLTELAPLHNPIAADAAAWVWPEIGNLMLRAFFITDHPHGAFILGTVLSSLRGLHYFCQQQGRTRKLRALFSGQSR